MCLFVFQAEDGIRDLYVTGVQTCALPIYRTVAVDLGEDQPLHGVEVDLAFAVVEDRSEERRVGKEWRYRWSPDHFKKKKRKSEPIFMIQPFPDFFSLGADASFID